MIITPDAVPLKHLIHQTARFDTAAICDGTELPFRFGVEIEDVLGLADGQAGGQEADFAISLFAPSADAVPATLYVH
jgi:hypothetical protein